MTDEGRRTRREVLGDERVDRAIESTTEFTADFQDLVTRYAWGEIWSRPGLDRRADHRGLFPLALKDKSRSTFSSWYGEWLDDLLQGIST